MVIDQQLKRLLENSGRLLEDSELLVQHGRYGSAFALAVLGLEEVGKAVLYKWGESEELRKLSLKKTFHVQKQLAVAHLLAAPLALEHIIEQIAIPNLRDLVANRLDVEDHVEALARKLYESEEGRWERHVELGVIDVLKQISIYDDGSKLNLEIRSSDVQSDSVVSITAKARRALALLDHELSMKIARATYTARNQAEN